MLVPLFTAGETPLEFLIPAMLRNMAYFPATEAGRFLLSCSVSSKRAALKKQSSTFGHDFIRIWCRKRDKQLSSAYDVVEVVHLNVVHGHYFVLDFICFVLKILCAKDH